MAVEPDESMGGVISADLSCVRCGYNLKTQGIRGACPECGLGVDATMKSITRRTGTNLRKIAWGAFLLSLVCLSNTAMMLLTEAPYFQWFNIGGNLFYLVCLALDISSITLLFT